MDERPVDLQDLVRRLSEEHLRRGDSVGWFEALYAAARGDPRHIPWAGLEPRPQLVEWGDRTDLRGEGRRALVVGCGLGDDAEELARRGFRVLAFDVSPTAIAWCRTRFPASTIAWEVADLFAPPEAWTRAFEWVLEEHTVQALPPERHREAMTRIAGFVAPGGTLFVLARARDEGPTPPGPPWVLARSELAAYVEAGLREVGLEDLTEGAPPVCRFRVVYQAGDGVR